MIYFFSPSTFRLLPPESFVDYYIYIICIFVICIYWLIDWLIFFLNFIGNLSEDLQMFCNNLLGFKSKKKYQKVVFWCDSPWWMLNILVIFKTGEKKNISFSICKYPNKDSIYSSIYENTILTIFYQKKKEKKLFTMNYYLQLFFSE